MNLEPTLVNIDTFLLAGTERFTDSGVQSLSDTWGDFERRFKDIRHKATPPVVWAYEDYSRGFELVPNGFPRYYFMVGVEVTSIDDLPSGIVGKKVVPGAYARFDFAGRLDDLKDVFRYIYDEWLPNSAYAFDPLKGADLVRYPEAAKDDVGRVEIYIPVVMK
jgi:predicted transcriptional regulator YdeE